MRNPAGEHDCENQTFGFCFWFWLPGDFDHPERCAKTWLIIVPMKAKPANAAIRAG